MLKLYLVDANTDYNRFWIVESNNKKEALDKLWDVYYREDNKQAVKEGYLTQKRTDFEITEIRKEMIDGVFRIYD